MITAKMPKEASIFAQIESFWLPAASFESSGNRKGKSIRFSLPMCRQPSIILTSTKILTTHTLLHLQGNRATGHEATNTSINSEMGGLQKNHNPKRFIRTKHEDTYKRSCFKALDTSSN